MPRRLYVLGSLLLPLLLVYPWAVANNFHGEGVQAGSPEFMPSSWIRYAPWNPERAPEDQTLSAALGGLASAVIGLFYASLINAGVAVLVVVKRQLDSARRLWR